MISVNLTNEEYIKLSEEVLNMTLELRKLDVPYIGIHGEKYYMSEGVLSEELASQKIYNEQENKLKEKIIIKESYENLINYLYKLSQIKEKS